MKTTRAARLCLPAFSILAAAVLPMNSFAQQFPHNDIFDNADASGGVTSPYTIDNDPITNSTNALVTKEWESRAGNAASPASQFSAIESFGLKLNGNSQAQHVESANSWCNTFDPENPDVSSGTCVAPEDQLVRYAAGIRNHAFNTYSPLSGVTDTLNAGTYVNQMSNALTSPLAVFNSTVNLTEPGIAAGLLGAFNVSGNAVSLRYQADNAIYNRLMANPSHGQFVVSAMESCIATARSGGKSWIQAQSDCFGGEKIDATTGTGANFDAVNASGQSFDFKYDPNHPSLTGVSAYGVTAPAGVDAGAPADNVIRALDYVFNQERNDPNITAQKKTSLDLLRQSFEQLIGDVEFRLSIAGDTSGADPATVTTNTGGYNVSIKKIAPYESPTAFYRNLVIARYQDVHAILFMRCQFRNGSSTGGAAAVSKFWADSKGAQLTLIRLSTSGSRMLPQTINALFSMFTAEPHQRSAFMNSRTSSQAGNFDCDALNANQGQPSDLSSIVSNSKTLAETSELRIQSAFALAEKIAFSQYMGILANAQDVVTNLSGGSYDSLIREYMLSAIYNVAGTKDIRGVQQENDDQLEQTIVPIVQQAGDRARDQMRHLLGMQSGDLA